MRDLSIVEMELIAGAGDVADVAAAGAALGGAAGVGYAVSIGGTGTAAAGMATIGAAVGGGLAAAAAGGYAVGNLINQHTNIQSAIANILPDPSGTDYAGTNYN